MHLGDFETDRMEIAVICNDCLKEKHPLWGIYFENGVLWEWKSEKLGMRGRKGKAIVISLTDNAWNNKDVNHPNEAYVEILKEGSFKEINKALKRRRKK